MRIALIGLFWALVGATPAYALGDLTAFPFLQDECVEIGTVAFGEHSRFAHCRIVKGRWFATIDFIDFYQAQYCLGNDGDKCEQTAQLVFANRAYTPVGRLMVERTDAAGTTYNDPLVVVGEHGRILVLSTRGVSSGAANRSYYRWEGERWVSQEPQPWLEQPEYQAVGGGENNAVPLYSTTAE